MAKIAFTFPGQGSQVVGMGKALGETYPEAKAVFDEVDAALGRKLSTIMLEGPDETLRLTENAQPALMAVSMAVVRALESEGISVSETAAFVAGHSLGEYSALCAAGAISLSDTARLLDIRGRAMQQAVPVGEGAMAALLGLDMDVVNEIAAAAAAGEVCDVANDNAPGQVVISGAATAVARAMEITRTKHGKRAMALPVSAPFHCRLMASAAKTMAEALADVSIKAPLMPVIANVTAQPSSDPDEIRHNLVAQVTGMVRWTESVSWLTGKGDIDTLIELGAGKVLTGLAKRTASGATARALGTPEDIAAYLAERDA